MPVSKERQQINLAFRTYGYVSYLFCLGYLICWFSWTLSKATKVDTSPLAEFYTNILYGDVKIVWIEVSHVQYILLLPLNIFVTAFAGLSVLPFWFNNYNTILLAFYQVLLFLSWFTGLIVLFFSAVYGNLTNNFETIMGALCFIGQFLSFLWLYTLIRKQQYVELEEKIEIETNSSTTLEI